MTMRKIRYHWYMPTHIPLTFFVAKLIMDKYRRKYKKHIRNCLVRRIIIQNIIILYVMRKYQKNCIIHDTKSLYCKDLCSYFIIFS